MSLVHLTLLILISVAAACVGADPILDISVSLFSDVSCSIPFSDSAFDYSVIGNGNCQPPSSPGVASPFTSMSSTCTIWPAQNLSTISAFFYDINAPPSNFSSYDATATCPSGAYQQDLLLIKAKSDLSSSMCTVAMLGNSTRILTLYAQAQCVPPLPPANGGQPRTAVSSGRWALVLAVLASLLL